MRTTGPAETRLSPGSVLPLRSPSRLPRADRRDGAGWDSYAVVIPTLGRRSLTRCLAALATARGPAPAQVILVNRRPADAGWTLLALPPAGMPLTVINAPGASPAAARNAGWQAAASEWVAFLDETSEVTPSWRRELAGDLHAQPVGVAGVRGRVIARALDGGPAGALAGTRWIPSDVAYRRAALADSGGFDERLPGRRENADLAQRLHGRGWALRTGRRVTSLPRPPLRHRLRARLP